MENLQRDYPVMAQSPIAASGHRLRSGSEGATAVLVQRSSRIKMWHLIILLFFIKAVV